MQTTRELGAHVATALGCELAPHEERDFDDGEHRFRPLVAVRGEDVYVLQSLHGDARFSSDDKLVRLLFFAAALRDHGAARLTAVLPYLAYGRKDRRTQPFDTVNSRYVAQLLEAVGIDTVVALEVHNTAAFDNAFRIPAIHLGSDAVLAPYVAQLVGDGPLVVASPDPGGIKRAQLFRETLARFMKRDCGSALVEKRRTEDVVSGSLLAGDVRGATVVLFDDLISTGTTLLRAAYTCVEHGAHEVIACAAHGVFAPGADRALLDPALASVLITDSVAFTDLAPPLRSRLQVVSVAPLLAETIRALHQA